MTEAERSQLLVYGMGAVGIGTIGYWGAKHMFVTGLTPDEKKGLLIGAIVAGVGLAAASLGLEGWTTMEGVGQKLESLLKL